MHSHTPSARSAAKDIVLLALDVDGVLTDGSIYIDDLGHETKRFNVRDGFGIRLWLKADLHAAIVTGRVGRAVQHRAAELGIPHVIQGSTDKAAALAELCTRLGCTPAQTAFVGDDWPDLSVLARVGLPIAVADADPRVLAAAKLITTAKGGHGAVREAVEFMLAEKGLLEPAARRFA